MDPEIIDITDLDDIPVISLNDDDIVLIHDAARPCLLHESIDALLLSLKTHVIF